MSNQIPISKLFTANRLHRPATTARAAQPRSDLRPVGGARGSNGGREPFL